MTIDQLEEQCRLSFGNSKTGPSWGLPNHICCPGKTKPCIFNCYGDDGRLNMEQSRALRMGNYRAVLRELKDGTLALTLKTLIRLSCIGSLRIHDVGDFFNVPYTDVWTEVCYDTPKVDYNTYTRSFVILNILRALTKLAGLSNTAVWLSADEENWEKALDCFKAYPEFSGIAFMETEGTRDIAKYLQRACTKDRFVNFPCHHDFGRIEVEIDKKLRNCPAIIGEIDYDKNNRACPQCRWCLPVQ